MSSPTKKWIKYQTNLKVHDISSSHATHPMDPSFAVSSVLSLAAAEIPCVALHSAILTRHMHQGSFRDTAFPMDFHDLSRLI